MWPFTRTPKPVDDINIEPLVELIELGVIQVDHTYASFWVLSKVPGSPGDLYAMRTKPELHQGASGPKWKLTEASWKRLIAACTATGAPPNMASTIEQATATRLAEYYGLRLAELDKKAA